MAIVYMPVTTIVTRSDPAKVRQLDGPSLSDSHGFLQNVAATFVAGSISDLLLNLNTLIVL